MFSNSKWQWRLLVLLMVVGAQCMGLPFLVYAEEPSRPLVWEQVADDFELANVDIWPGSLLSPQVLFVRTSLRRYQIRVLRAAELGQKRLDVRRLANSFKAVLGINANFFDENMRPLGLVVNRGILHQNLHRGGKTLTGVFQISGRGPRIMSRADFDPRSVREAVQGGPRLLVDAKPVKGLRYPDAASRRAGVCVDRKGRVVFFISRGLIGVSSRQLQEVLSQKEVDCVNALNLDGGGSAQLFISSSLPGAKPELQSIDIQGRDAVPVALGLFVVG